MYSQHEKIIRRINYAMTINFIYSKLDKRFEDLLINQDISLEQGFANFESQIKTKDALNRNFMLTKKTLKSFDKESREILIDYFYKNKTSFDICKRNGISNRTFFRVIKRLEDKFNEVYERLWEGNEECITR